MADNIFYRDAFIVCNVVTNEDAQAKLDVPFQLYHQTITENNNQHYCYLTNDLIVKEVLVYIHHSIEDENKIKSFIGYLGNTWSDVSKDSKVTKYWSIKKEDALATKDKDGIEVKYDKADKDEIIHPYMAEDIALKK